MHFQFSFFQPSSHFSWDTHSKQSIRLDEEGFLWLSFCSFGSWSNSFDLCRTLHALNAISSCILCILHLFVCIAFVFILLLCFSFVWVKIQNHIKSENFKKFDRICLSTFHMWVWPCTFVQMALCIIELSLIFLHFVRLNFINNLVGFISYQICLYFSN